MKLKVLPVFACLIGGVVFVEGATVRCPGVLGAVSCEEVDKKLTVFMKCPDNNTKLRFWNTVIQFSQLQKITIANCTKLTIDFAYKHIINHSVFRRNILTIDTLRLENITELIINSTTIDTPNLFPESVSLKNVSFETIYEDTFVQPVEIIITKPLKNLYFTNVTCKVIETKSFDDLKGIDNFVLKQVNVQRIQAHAIKVQMSEGKKFEIIKSKIDVLEHLALQVTSKFLNIKLSEFLDVYPGAINGTVGIFDFGENVVGNLQSGGLSLLAQNIKIHDSHLKYLKSGAFERISPGLLQDSRMNFGNLRFTYEFQNNYVNFLEAGSLNPDITAYDNVATDVMFVGNSFYCTCNNFGWIFSEIGHGINTDLLEDFYKNVLDAGNKNECFYTSCKLFVKEIRNIIKDGRCVANKTAEDVCRDKQKRTTEKVSTEKGGFPTTVEVKVPELPLQFFNTRIRSAGDFKKVDFLFVPLLSVIFF